MEEMKVIFRRLALLRTFFYYIEFKILKKKDTESYQKKKRCGYSENEESL